MIESLKRIFAEIKRVWEGLPPNRKVVISAVSTATLVGLIALLLWARHITYVVLYSNLDPQEAALVVERLKKDKIPYGLSKGGTTILVPSRDVYDIRLQLAGEGIPRTGAIGYEIFDKTNLGLTDFLQRVNYRRALEGELTKTIQQMEGVQAVRVHIVIPEQRLFKESQREPTASVVLKLRKTSSLSPRQIRGITHLVASSVEGLKPSGITIVDYNGNLLSSGTGGDQISALSQDQFQLQSSVEAYLERKAQSLLDGVIGPGRSIVRVRATLDFERVEKTIEQYDPDRTAIRSEQKTEENSTNSGRKENTVINYEVNKTLQHIVSSVGNIKKLSIALIIDTNSTDSNGAVVTRSQEEIAELSDIVKRAVGFVSERDQFEVASMAFNRSFLLEEQKLLDKAAKRQVWTSFAQKGWKVVVGLLIFLVVRSVIKSLARGIVKKKMAEVTLSKEAKALSEGEQKNKIFVEVSSVVKKKPHEAARLIRTLLEE